MGLISFLIVAVFNIYWLIEYDFETYLEVFNPKDSGVLSYIFIFFNLWGFFNFIYIFL